MNRVETRELEYFLAVADTLHFARAAEKLGIAPPPLSRVIAQLERRMGIVLFERTSRRVRLTGAGRVFAARAREVLQTLDRAVTLAQRAGQGVLRVATTPGTGSGLLREMVRGYAGRFGADAIELVFARDVASAVRDGRADVALACSTHDLSGLDTASVAVEHPVVLVPSDHDLASRETVTSAQLRRDRSYRAECPAVGLDALADLVATGRLVVVVGDSVLDCARVDNAGALPRGRVGPLQSRDLRPAGRQPSAAIVGTATAVKQRSASGPYRDRGIPPRPVLRTSRRTGAGRIAYPTGRWRGA